MLGGPEEMVPAIDIARLFHVSRKTLDRWTVEREFPTPFYIGRSAFYRAFEVRLWQEQQMKNREPPSVGEKKGKRKADNSGHDGTN
jgi:predicted DNA-binding transcriptional regulator AlpA